MAAQNAGHLCSTGLPRARAAMAGPRSRAEVLDREHYRWFIDANNKPSKIAFCRVGFADPTERLGGVKKGAASANVFKSPRTTA